MSKVAVAEFQTMDGVTVGSSKGLQVNTKERKSMNIVLWILQVLLAVQFLFHGWIILFPPAELAPIINAQFATWFRLFVGITESLGALGLLLPGMTRIWPWLTSWAGVGLMIVAISASGLHFARGETASAITTVVLFGLLAFVSYRRWTVVPTRENEL